MKNSTTTVLLNNLFNVGLLITASQTGPEEFGDIVDRIVDSAIADNPTVTDPNVISEAAMTALRSDLGMS
jgi:hypothetical protein